jgi:hypothetical protein
MRVFLKEQSLSLFFLLLFLGSLVGQSLAGQKVHNQEQVEHGGSPISWSRYVTSSDFGQAVMENWQSEFLQFTVFILATIWLVQRGSAESKRPDEVGVIEQGGGSGAPSLARMRGLPHALYENSLLLVMLVIFLGSWLAQSVTAWTIYNDDQREHGSQAVSWGAYLLGPDFWEKTLQNWQSEFLAVGTMAVFTIYLRQRGSPESKPVAAAHADTTSN